MIVRPIAVATVTAFSLALSGCGGGGSSSSTPPTLRPTPLPSSNPPAPPPGGSTQSSAACPTSASASSVATSSVRTATRFVSRSPAAQRFVPGMIVYTDASGAMHVERTDPARVQSEMSRLRLSGNVRHVQQAQYRRLMAVTPNDPYYRGFGPGAPYNQSSTEPGQWDMHVINLGTAWASIQKGAPIAVIDTGVDVNHPELRGRIAYARCYVTYPTSSPQTSGPYVTDLDGHGTNVAGIADAATNNAFGFAGTAFAAPLLAFRVFPSPPSAGCPPSSTNAQCDTTDVDEVSAINDAVAHGARVINLSVGAAGPLSNCKDTIEENAVENAIAHGVVVVAAAGNESANHLDCPAAYPGVIAVGASALEGSANSVTEGVAAYSNYAGSAGPGGGGAYLVAPGGDPSGNTDDNNLHWIENIYSSTAVSPGSCGTDAAGQAGDCRILIAGTSQATPHVAGVVSLMLGLRPGLTPAQVAADLCGSATNIGNRKQGCGRLNAAGAVARAAQ
ncbi:MAG TPA: S8 family serine peptidase [Candidatus Baltobacteraceae bacterium]|nr:S8 family serine peptidase [Candidatus Baltobacteraceae bacterium]